MRSFILAAALSLSAMSALADGDPTTSQIYAAANGGHLDQAQQMITQVLADHPTSPKAHYVQAELFAKEGKTTEARAELGTVERLNPGLTDFSERSVAELKGQLGLAHARPSTEERPAPYGLSRRVEPGIPWGKLLIAVGVIALLFMLFRRRPTYNQYPAAGAGPGYGPPGAGYGPGYGPGPMGGGGVGSGIAGGLASGLAVGAGVVAGEELAHHFMDGGRHDGGVIPSADASEPGSSNSDMGGSDFGVNDSGSWDDGGGSGGGGDDWS